MDCLYCSHQTKIFVKTKDINRKIDNNLFRYNKCNQCGTVQLENIPSDLSFYYPKNYYGPTPETEEAIKSAAEIIEAYKIDLVKSYCKNIKTILEIGPSMGGFSILAKYNGYDIKAIEMSKDCSNFLNKVAGIPTIHTKDEIESIKQHAPVDLIAMWHVIEHLKNPINLLKETIKKILPNGYILIAAPNPDSLQFRILRSKWVHLDAPRHVNLIPMGILIKFFEQNGFKTILSTTNDRGSLAWNDFGWEYSIKNILGDRLSKNISQWTQSFFNKQEKKDGNGSCFTLIVQKTN